MEVPESIADNDEEGLGSKDRVPALSVRVGEAVVVEEREGACCVGVKVAVTGGVRDGESSAEVEKERRVLLLGSSEPCADGETRGDFEAEAGAESVGVGKEVTAAERVALVVKDRSAEEEMEGDALWLRVRGPEAEKLDELVDEKEGRVEEVAEGKLVALREGTATLTRGLAEADTEGTGKEAREEGVALSVLSTAGEGVPLPDPAGPDGVADGVKVAGALPALEAELGTVDFGEGEVPLEIDAEDVPVWLKEDLEVALDEAEPLEEALRLAEALGLCALEMLASKEELRVFIAEVVACFVGTAPADSVGETKELVVGVGAAVVEELRDELGVPMLLRVGVEVGEDEAESARERVKFLLASPVAVPEGTADAVKTEAAEADSREEREGVEEDEELRDIAREGDLEGEEVEDKVTGVALAVGVSFDSSVTLAEGEAVSTA